MGDVLKWATDEKKVPQSTSEIQEGFDYDSKKYKDQVENYRAKLLGKFEKKD